MIRPSAQALTKTAAAAAAAILTLAGCKPLTTTNAPVPAAPRAPTQSGPLITEPAAGFSPVYHLIKHARHSVDLTMYEFSDTKAEHGLAAAARRGVTVKVVLDQREKSHNSGTFDYLKSHGVKVVWSSPQFEYTHQKTLLVDGSTALIMTANLTSEYYSSTRDFLVVDTKPADVRAIAQVFQADFAHRSIHPGDGRDLVWSPTDSQAQLLALIGGARKSLRIYSEEMADTTVEDALIEAARRGVVVKVCGENTSGQYDSDFSRLAAAGVHISYYSSSHGFYIHGKVVEADYGTSHAKVFIGSENFSSTSLSRNRELGLITGSQKVMSSITSTFAADYRNGKHWA
ncbi:MAG: phosphatidylserine/phosphatidylglycerophosphate/cardiolipin synthase-like protein [Actinomycetia bacterium]|nr:phosphatidylserine/phosphatidylglycerophosphate/cardiolipin synthase-like protein [Actinomycetes bacterium]